MVSAGAVILIILFVIWIISLPILFIIIRFWRFPKLSGTKILFEDTSRSYGYAIADLIAKEIGKNGRIIFECLPLGVSDAKTFSYIVEPNKIDIRPKNTWWKDYDVIRILPHNASEWFANAFKEVEEKNATTNIEKALRGAVDLQAMHIKNIGGGEVSRADMALIEDWKKQFLKSTNKEERTGRPGTYPSANVPRDNF